MISVPRRLARLLRTREILGMARVGDSHVFITQRTGRGVRVKRLGRCPGSVGRMRRSRSSAYDSARQGVISRSGGTSGWTRSIRLCHSRVAAHPSSVEILHSAAGARLSSSTKLSPTHNEGKLWDAALRTSPGPHRDSSVLDSQSSSTCSRISCRSFSSPSFVPCDLDPSLPSRLITS